jgi:putative transposase
MWGHRGGHEVGNPYTAWGECSPKRKGYRNGTYTRDLATATGRLEDLNIPRDREGQFHTQVFDRDTRFEPHIAEGLTQMFVAGTSTHKVGEVAHTLLGVAPSGSRDQSPQPDAQPAI